MADRQISRVREIDVAAVAGNGTLAAGVDRRALERCKDAIEKLGVLHTPVVGATEDGGRRLLSGQCELTALRELGVRKAEAVEVRIGGGAGDGAKLSLLLMSLRERPGALCEGHLIRDAMDAGVPRPEIQEMLGKSSSWVSNRLSLVSRLDANVYELVRGGILGARSAEEVARLPERSQFAFAEAAVREGLPKSAIAALVAGYRDETCPDAVRAQIVGDPRAALARMADTRRSVAEGGGRRGRGIREDAAGWRIKSAKSRVCAILRDISGVTRSEAESCLDALAELETGLLELLAAVRGLVYPGKAEVGISA